MLATAGPRVTLGLVRLGSGKGRELNVSEKINTGKCHKKSKPESVRKSQNWKVSRKKTGKCQKLSVRKVNQCQKKSKLEENVRSPGKKLLVYTRSLNLDAN